MTAFGYRRAGDLTGRYYLNISTQDASGRAVHSATLSFADKPAALAHARCIGATFTC